MAHTVKGDINVLGKSVAHGYDMYQNITVAATATAVDIDMSGGSRSFVVHLSPASTGDIDINTPINIPSLGNKIRISIGNTDVIDRNIVFGPEYLLPNGQPAGTMTVLADEGRALELYYVDASPTTWVIVVDTGGVVASTYTQEFDDTTDWGTGVGGLYTITVPAATHAIVDPTDVSFQFDDGVSWVGTTSEFAINKTTGDVSFTAEQSPSGRYAGRVVIK